MPIVVGHFTKSVGELGWHFASGHLAALTPGEAKMGMPLSALRAPTVGFTTTRMHLCQ